MIAELIIPVAVFIGIMVHLSKEVKAARREEQKARVKEIWLWRVTNKDTDEQIHALITSHDQELWDPIITEEREVYDEIVARHSTGDLLAYYLRPNRWTIPKSYWTGNNGKEPTEDDVLTYLKNQIKWGFGAFRCTQTGGLIPFAKRGVLPTYEAERCFLYDDIDVENMRASAYPTYNNVAGIKCFCEADIHILEWCEKELKRHGFPGSLVIIRPKVTREKNDLPFAYGFWRPDLDEFQDILHPRRRRK